MRSGRGPASPWARFDDLRAGTAVRCPPPRRLLIAERSDEVLVVLTRAERCTDAGAWAAGYVAYEAAAGLDPRLAVHRTTPMGMPLVWFGLWDEPVPVPPLEVTGPAAVARWRPTWNRPSMLAASNRGRSAAGLRS